MSTKNIIILAVLGLIFMVGCNGYNGLVTQNQEVESKWSEVENQYQRRASLIPNLVNTVKGAANFEQSTLTGVMEARASATQMKISASELTEENIQKYQQLQGQLGSALGRLMSVTENYPELKANQNFRDLSAELAGTENRITIARRDFNEVVKTFNTKVATFPNSLMSGMFGFKTKAYFKSDAGSDKAPEVKF